MKEKTFPRRKVFCCSYKVKNKKDIVMQNKVPVEKGKNYELNIHALGTSGEGVGRLDGFTIFVRGVLPGETANVRIVAVKKTYAAGVLVKLLSKSSDRVSPKCPVYEDCGGCQIQHLSYEAQLREKRRQVYDAVTRIGGFPKSTEVLPTLGAVHPWNYRNKMQFPVGLMHGRVLIGCFARGSHRIIDTLNCYIQKEGNNEIAAVMRAAVKELRIPVYDEDKHRGVLRHVIGRVGEGGKMMLVLVTATKELPRERALVNFLRQRLPNVVSIQQNIQTYRSNVIMGRETRLLWGSPTIIDRIGRLKFHISPRSFFQVNSEQAAVLYGKALEYANLKGEETVIDAYCGTGTITLFLAQKAHRAIGIEIVRPAIEDAKKNARDNSVKNAEFIVGDASAVMPRLYRQGVRPDVVVVDPPRAGCTEEVLKTFVHMNPQRIVYVSCNPATLARDMKLLHQLGYAPQKIQPVDLFSQTNHVETVALLEKIS